MNDYDLSILIPALKEEFLANTVEDILKNKRGKTEVIVGLDGAWPGVGEELVDHPDVRVIYVSKNRGQRGMTNLLAKLSTAKYVAKVDAHCAFDEGFDVKLMEAVKGHGDWTIVPVMRNMHVFNWKCKECGEETYQGAIPEGCKNCHVNTPEWFEKKLVWNPKPSPQSSAYKFTPTKLQFKYFGSLKKAQLKSGERLVETMSLQGSFFMLTRDKYWELDICDETWGGWGQQGTEVALKTWLSGGRVVCLLDTWYAHMFRTQNGFAFPWNGGKISQGRQQQQARQISVDLFKNNRWPKQVRPLSWLVERFWQPLQEEPDTPDDPRWQQADLAELKRTEAKFIPVANTNETKGILYFTDNELPLRYARPVQKAIRDIAEQRGMELVSSSRKPMHDMGKNVITPEPRGYLTMFKQILKGLEAMESDVVFMAEHDVLYPTEHFSFTPSDKDTFYYDQNWWKIHTDGFAIHWDADQVSGLCAYRDKLIDYYRQRVETFNRATFDRKFEPFSGIKSKAWKASRPHIDIRHGRNLTLNKRSLADFRRKDSAVNLETTTIDKVPGWDNLSDIL